MKKLLTFATCVATMLLVAASCSSDEELLDTNAGLLASLGTPTTDDRTGEVIDFNAYSNLNATDDPTTGITPVVVNNPSGKKRLHYLDKGDGDTWPLSWDNGDTLHIYSPEAMKADEETGDETCTQIAEYLLTEGETSNIAPANAKKLHWGVKNLHTFFYYYYPKGYVELRNYTLEEGATKRMIYETAINEEQIVEDADIREDYETPANAWAINMDYAPMIGMSRYEKTNPANKIDLWARPAFTAVDVVLSASSTDQNSVADYIYSLDLTSMDGTPLSGYFWGIYDEKYRDASTTGEKVYTDSYELTEITGNQVRVTLKNPYKLESKADASQREKLKITAFLLPTAQPTNLRISINRTKETTDGQTSTITPVSKTSATATGAIQAGKYNHIILGELPPAINYPTFIDPWEANPIDDGPTINENGEWQHMN